MYGSFVQSTRGPAANCLLARGPIGAVKPFTHDLPPEDHIYGKAYPGDRYGVRELTSSWNNYKNGPEPLKDIDYKKLNKKLCREGAVTSPMSTRARHDERQNVRFNNRS